MYKLNSLTLPHIYGNTASSGDNVSNVLIKDILHRVQKGTVRRGLQLGISTQIDYTIKKILAPANMSQVAI